MRTPLLAVALALAGCAHAPKSEAVCPEHRDMLCVIGVECSKDKTRGCVTCRCVQMGLGGRMPPVDAPR